MTEGEEQYDRSEGFTYTEVIQKPGECLEKTCRHHGDSTQMLKVNMIPVPDALMSHSTEEEFDKPIILHLWPTVLLRNLLPYPITFTITVHETSQSLSTECDMCGLTWHSYYITVKRDAHIGYLAILETFHLSVSVHISYKIV